jgi:hypothetical protein
MTNKILITLFICIGISPLLSHTVHYQWYALEENWELSLNFSDELYDFYSQRTRLRDYDLFVTDYFDDEIIRKVNSCFIKALPDHNLESYESLQFVIAFVQSFDYIDDLSTKGTDEYPKYPYETLYDAKGDCEDSAILLAALLLELKQDVILLEFEHHLAVAIALPEPDFDGYYVDFDHKTYFYIETTGMNWGIGELPEEYQGSSVTILELKKRPSFQLSSQQHYNYNGLTIKMNCDIKIQNLGSVIANDTKIDVAAVDFNNYILAQNISNPFILSEEEEMEYRTPQIEFPCTKPFKIYITVYYLGKAIEQLVSEWQYLE